MGAWGGNLENCAYLLFCIFYPVPSCSSVHAESMCICCSYFFLQLNFILPLFLSMVMYDNEFKTKKE